MNPEVCLKISSLSKRYKGAQNDALQGIDISIKRGQKFGIIGPNGAGKTTLISIICGLITPSSGNYKYAFASTVNSEKEEKKRIGFVPQEFSFYEELTVKQNFDFFGAMYGLSKNEIAQNGSKLIDVLGLKDVFKKKILTFSGGMKRRVNLGIGMLHKPSILFLDEPTAGVDVQSKHAIFSYLNSINEQGCTIVYTSHHMAEAEEFCSDIAIIDHGKLLRTGNLASILSDSTGNLESLFLSLTGMELRDKV
jgi:ABC-2 type transport system ATP-binding protein